jgi:hypothetical protein
MPAYQPFIPFTECPWIEIHDGNKQALDIYSRHYSKYRYKDGRKVYRFVGPGERMVLLSQCGRALFVWRRFKAMNNQTGINCAVFRNETEKPYRLLSSDLIREAERLAWLRWPGERLYTYVNPDKIISTNPGYCFQASGWTKCGITKVRHLIILEKFPAL